MASKGILKNSGSIRMAPQGKPPPPAPTVVFGRRTDSGRFISYSRDDLDSEISSVDFQDYHVHIPMTPDNQPIDEDGGKAGDQ
jgi:cellulose synthase-like protein